MHTNIAANIVSVCAVLNDNDVEYLIVGGTAVAFHGYFRWSLSPSGKPAEKYDLDIWYYPSYDNYFRLLKALEVLGQDVTIYTEEKTPDPRNSFFKFEMSDLTLDFLPKIKSLQKFVEAYKKKQLIRFNEVEIKVVSFEDLINDKKVSGREKDLLDIKVLKERKKDN